MKDEMSNPFDKQFSMTSLERTIKNTQNGTPNGSNFGNKTLSRKKEVITRGVLSVTVLAAEDLPAMDITGKSDPYVVLHMKKSKTKHKTRVSFLAKWVEISFLFLIMFLYLKNVCLLVYIPGLLIILVQYAVLTFVSYLLTCGSLDLILVAELEINQQVC